MAAGGTTTLVNLLKVKSNDLLVGNGVTGTGSLRVTIASDNTPISVNSAQPTTTGALTAIATGGQLTVAATLLYVGQTVVIAGSNTGSGTITNGTYRISVTNGSTTFTLVNLDGTAITTTAGTPSGLTYSTFTPDVISNLSMMAGQTIAMGTGVRTAGTQRVTIATDDIVPVSQSGTWNINALTSITNALPTGTNSIGNIGTVSTLTSLTQFNGTAITMKAASTAAVVGDTSLVVGLSPNSPLPAGTNGIGKLTANTGVTIGAVEIAATQTLSTVTTVSTVTSLTQMNGQAIAMGTGVRSAGTQRVTIATDDFSSITDSNNSSIVNLASAATYTGTGTDVSAYAQVSVTIFSDQNSGINGLSLQFSQDNVNWNTETRSPVGANVEITLSSPVMARYFRVFYQNSANITGAFRLQTRLHAIARTPSTKIATTTIWPTDQVSLTNSILSAPSTTNGTVFNSGVIKSSSTSAAATDQSLVVALSPNSPLPTGSNAIGKLTANTGVIIGAVEIAATQTLGTVTTVSTVTNLSQLGGAAIAMGTGVRSAGTQRVTIATDDVVPASQSGTWNITNISGTVSLPTGAATETTLASALTALQLIDNAVATPGSAHGTGILQVGGSDGTNATRIRTDASGFVKVSPKDISTNANNSTTTNLVNAAVFTGTGTDVSAFSQVMVNVFASHASAANGLSIQFSQDGTNWDSTNTYTVAATTDFAIILPITHTYYRLVYTNGATTTTTLRITSLLSSFTTQATIKKLNTAVNLTDTALSTRSVISGTTTGATPSALTDATVKLGSISVVGTDTALVVAIRDGLPAGANVIGSISNVGTVTTVSTVTNLSQLGGTAIAMNTGVRSAGTQRVTIATDDAIATVTSLTQFNGTAISMKAANVAPALADPALVVALSPNSQQLTTPSGVPSVATASTGGSLPASTTYFFKLVAVDAGGGTTIPGPEASIATAVGTATNTVTITWPPITGADSYQVWWATASGAQASYFPAPINLSTSGTLTNSYVFSTVTGTFSGTTPSTNTTSFVRQKAIQPVSGPLTDTQLRATAVPVSGSGNFTVTQATAANLNATVTGTVELGATSLAALENISVTVPGTVDLGTVSLTALETITVTSGTPNNFQSKVYGAVTTAAPAYTNATDNALSLTTSGALRVDGSAVTQPVSGTFWQATQPVSIAASVAVTGPLTSAQTLTALTNLVQFNGTAISMKAASTAAVAGDTALVVSVSPNTAVNLAADDVHDGVAGTTGVMLAGFASSATPTGVSADGDAARIWVSRSGAVIIDGYSKQGTATALAAVNANSAIQLGGSKAAGVTITAISTPVGITLTPQVSFDGGTTWTATAFKNLSNGDIFSTITNTNLIVGYTVSIIIGGGVTHVRVIALAYGSGSVTVQLSASEAIDTQELFVASNNSAQRPLSTAQVGGWDGTNLRSLSVTSTGAVNIGSIASALPTGTNSIGNIGTVSTVTNLSQLGGTAISMNTGVRDAGTLRVTIATNDIVPASQSGTWNINALTSITNALPTGTNSIGNIGTVSTVTSLTQFNGTAIPMKAASTAAAATDTSLVVALSPNSPLPAGTNGIGKLTANSGVIIGDVNIAASQSIAVTQATAANLNATVSIAAAQTLGTVTTVSTVTNLSQLGGTAIAMNTGVRSTGTLRVTIATDDIVQTKATPDATGTYAGTNATTTVYATNLVIKASAGTVYMLSGYNSLATAQFIQLHNATALPADTSVPSVIFYVPGLSNFSFDFGVYGRFFSTGVVVCNSTTGPTKTIGAANCWFDAQFK